MMSNSHSLLGVSNYTYPPAGVNTDTVVIRGERNFVVNPSPLINRGDRKRPNAYTFSITQADGPKGFIMRDNDQYGTQTTTGYLTENFGLTPAMQLLFPQVQEIDVRNKALAKLYSKIKNSDINASVTAGEGRETLTLLRAVGLSALKVQKELRGAVRRSKRNPAWAARILLQRIGKPIAGGMVNPLQTVGGFQLLWSLALGPLIADVENYRNHEASKSDADVELHFDSRASSTHEEQRDNVNMGSGLSRTELISESMRIEFGVNLRITDMVVFEDWRIGATVRPSLGWELSTMSFLIDYFVNVGQYIELQEAALMNNGMQFVHGYQTITYKCQTEIESDYMYRGYDYTDSHHWEAAKLVKTKNRGVLQDFPIPYGVTVKLPSAATPLLNCAALLSQLIARRG